MEFPIFLKDRLSCKVLALWGWKSFIFFCILNLRRSLNVRSCHKTGLFSLVVALKDPPVSRGSRASSNAALWITTAYVGDFFSSLSVYMFRAGTIACLHLPSVYIVMCLMKRDHSFVKQHVGQRRRGRCVKRSNRELSVGECVFSGSNKRIIR